MASMKLRHLFVPIALCASTLAGQAASLVPYGQVVPELATALAVQVKQNPRSTWNSGVGTYWIPGTSFAVSDKTNPKAAQAAGAFGALGALAYIGAATKAAADKVVPGSAEKLPDLEKMTELALQQAFTAGPARQVLAAGNTERYPAITVTPSGGFAVTNEQDATFSIGLAVTIADADKQVVWRGSYSYSPGVIQPLSGWLSDGDNGVTKTTERALAKLSRLLAHDLERRPYPDKKEAEVNRKAKNCGLMAIAKRVTLLETEGDLRTAATELDERNGTVITVLTAKDFDHCFAGSVTTAQ
jgi:hypothetical protein